MKLRDLPMFKSSLALLLIVLASLQVASAEPIPAARRIDWTYAGVPGGIPNRTNICATLNPGASASSINSAIAACGSSGGGVVNLSAGSYNLTGIQVFANNVTLRGAGADQTLLKGCNIMRLGSGRNIASGIAITGGAAKDATTFTVASTAGLSVNTMIEIDRDNDPNIVVSTIGGSRHMRQVNMVTAISGNTVTVRNPLIWDFNAGNPKIKFTFANTRFSGVENLKLDHSGTSGCNNFDFQYCYGCWIKGVESYKPAGYHMVILGTLNGEIRDSYIHDASTYGNNNAGLAVYGSSNYGSNSSMKIENSIFNRTFPAIELQNSSSGFYIGYNYSYGSMAQAAGAPVTWTFADNHGPHDMMNLWEGNVGEMFGSDGYYSGSSHATVIRNYLTGHNPNSGNTDDPIRLNRLSYFFNLVGNVLGSTNENPRKYEQTAEGCSGGPSIYRLGYPNIGNCGLTDVTGNSVPGGMSYPDAKVKTTLLRWGNYDYFHRAARWMDAEIPSGIPAPADQALRASYYYSARPTWWKSGVPWPPIGPDVTGGTADALGFVHKIPAQLCWESRNLLGGGTFNAAACYASAGGGAAALPPPANLRLVP